MLNKKETDEIKQTNEVDTNEDFSAVNNNTNDGWKFGRVNTGNKNPLNLRSNPDKKATVLSHIPDGTIISVKIYDNKWYHVKYNGLEGYCMKDFVV